MADIFSIKYVTDIGKQLIAQAIAGTITLEFTGLATGSGTYTAGERTKAAMQARTALKSEKNRYPFSSVSIIDNDSVQFIAMISNMDPDTQQNIVDEAYYINEIGLYGKDTDSAGAAQLIAIAITGDQHGSYLPPYDGSNLVEVEQTYYINVDNAGDINFTYQSSAYATAAALAAETAARTEADFNNLYGLCTKTTTIATVNGNKEITETGDGVTAVTVIVKNSDTLTTITTTVTPTAGNEEYVKVTTITKTLSGKTIAESYTTQPKS